MAHSTPRIQRRVGVHVPLRWPNLSQMYMVEWPTSVVIFFGLGPVLAGGRIMPSVKLSHDVDFSHASLNRRAVVVVRIRLSPILAVAVRLYVTGWRFGSPCWSRGDRCIVVVKS